MLRQLLFALCFACSAWAAEVQLAWDPNSEPDLAGYRIHYGTASGSYSVHVDVGNVTAYTAPGLADQTRYYFVATAYDNAIPSNESGYSNEVNWASGEPPVYIGATNITASKLQVGSMAQNWAYVNDGEAATNSCGATTDLEAIAATAGNAILVAVGTVSSTGYRPTTSIADTAGNTYTLLASYQVFETYYHRVEIWAAYNISGNASNVVTLTNNATTALVRAIAVQYSGLATSSTQDADYAPAGNTDGASAYASTAAAIANNDELIFGAFLSLVTGIPTFTASSPSNLREQAGTVGSTLGVADNYGQTASSSYNVAVASSTTINVYCLARAFKQAAAASAVPANRGNVGMMLGMSNAMWLDNDFIKPLGGN